MDSRHHKRVFGLSFIVIVVGLVSLFTDLSSEMIVPVLPLFLTSVLHVPYAAIGLIEGIAESTASLLKPFSGWFSDALGRRKPLMVAGYGFSNLVKPLLALSTNWGQVLALRFADRFGKGVRGAPRDALLADVTAPTERGKVFGFHRAMDTVGAALGPLSAFAILAVYSGHYRLVFFASAVPGVLAVLCLVFGLREQAAQRGASQSKRPRLALWSLGRRYVTFALVATLFALGNSSDAFLVLRAQNVGMAASHVPLAYFVFNVTYALCAVPAGVLSDRIGRRAVLVFGYVVFAIIYLGFGIADSPLWIWLLFVVYGLYYAATEGVQKAYVSDLVGSGQRGMALGTFDALTGLATFPASLVAGLLWQSFGPTTAFVVSAVCALCAALLMVLLRV